MIVCQDLSAFEKFITNGLKEVNKKSSQKFDCFYIFKVNTLLSVHRHQELFII